MSLAFQNIRQADDCSVPKISVPYTQKAVVVIGAGPVGMHFVNELLAKTNEYAVVVYGNEPWKPYDRVKLSSYLAGDVDREELELDSQVFAEANIEYRPDCNVEWIDHKNQTVKDALVHVQSYSHLVRAVGSSPYMH